MAVFRGWRFAALIGVIFGGVALTLYPVAIAPMIDSSYYSK